MSLPAYTVVIVGYNGKEVLGPTLDALLASKPKPAEIIVVDNGSTDGVDAMVLEKYPQVTFIRSGGNVGFGKGNNIGIKAAKTPYVFLVNNDLLVEPDCAQKLIESLEADRTYAVASPLTYRGWDMTNTSDIYSYGLRIDQAGFTVNVETQPAENEASNCFSGACCMLRADLLKQELFEPRYFMYYEEPELMIRYAKQGYASTRVPDAIAWHLEAYSSPGKAAVALAFRQYNSIQNRWYALGKHWPARLLPKALAYNSLHLVYFTVFFLRNKQYKAATVCYKAPWGFFLGLFHRSSSDNHWWKMLFPASLGGMMRLKKRVIR